MTVCGTGDWSGPVPGDPDNNYSISAQATFGGINVSWTYPTINPYAVSYFQLYRGQSAVFANAVAHVKVSGSFHYDKLDTDQAQYYWVKLVSIHGTEGALIGPAFATPSYLTSTLIDAISGDITSGTLSLELNTRIDGIQVLRSDIDAEIDAINLAAGALSGALGDTDAAVALAVSQLQAETAARLLQAAVTAQEVLDSAMAADTALDAETSARVDAISQEARNRVDAVDATAEALLRNILNGEQAALNAANQVALARSEIRTDIIAGISAEASQRDLLATRMTTENAVTTGLISSESIARSDAFIAEAVQRNLLATQFRGSYTGTDIGALTEGLIYNEKVARASETAALTQQIALLSVGNEQFDWKSIWYFDSGIDAWTGNGTPTAGGGFLRPADQASSAYVESPVDLAVDSSIYNQVRLRVRKTGTVTWAGFVYWKATGDTTWDNARRIALTEPTWDINNIGLVTATPAWAGTIQQIRVDLASAQTVSNYVEFDWVSIGRPSPGASSAQLLSEQTTRFNDDQAIAGNLLILSTQVNDSVTGLGQTRADVISNMTVLSNADTAEANARLLLAGRVTNAEDGLATAQGDILDEVGLRVTGDQTNADATLLLSGQVNHATTGLPATRATLLDFQSISNTATTANATDIKSLSAKAAGIDEDALTALLNGEANLTSTNAGMALIRQELQTNITAGLLAESTSREVLAVQLNTTNANIVNEQTARVTQDEAIAQSIKTLSAEITDPVLGLKARATALETVTTEAESGNFALALRATTLEGVVNNETTGVAATADVLDTISLLVNNSETGVSATAGKLTTLTARIDTPTEFNNATYATLVNSYRTTVLTDTAISSAVNAVISNLNTPDGFYTSIVNTKTTAESKSASFVQGTTPTATKTNDLWVDTANGNLLKRWNGSAWVVADDTRIGTQASLVTTLQSQLATTTSSPLLVALESEVLTRATETGGLLAQYSVKIDNAGYLSGFGLQSSLTVGGAATSTFLVSVDKFAVAVPTTSVTNWVASTVYAVSDMRGVAGNTTKVLVCKQAGQSGTVLPDISGAVGTLITDNLAKWQIASRVPFSVMTVPTTVNGITVPAGTYIDGAYITNASITSAQISGTLDANKINGYGLSIYTTDGVVLLSAGSTTAVSTFSGNVTGNIDGTLASTVKTNASTALTNAATANALLADIASDSKLTPAEKIPLLRQWNDLYNEKAGINAQATAMGVTGEAVGYNLAFTTLANYLNNGSAWTVGATPPNWLSTTYADTTDVNAATFRTNWSAVYTARQTLLNKIAEVAATKATWAGIPPGSGKAADNATVGAPSGTSVGSSTADAVSGATVAVNDATTGLAQRMRLNADNILGGVLVANTASAPVGLRVGTITWNVAGARTAGYGVAITPTGLAAFNVAGHNTFLLSGATGAVTISSGPSGARTEITATGVRVYDSVGALRVKIGDLTV